MNYSYIYPLAAIVGQEDMKEALLIALVNPQVGGVLISGNKATGKSTMLRAAMNLTDVELVEMPLSATEDRVFGNIDLEKTLASGERVFSPGLVSRAHHSVLYIDEINLLRRELLTAVLQVHDAKENRVERDGFSYSHSTEFLLIGTMNPEEGTLSNGLLDRFGLFVNVEPLNTIKDRVKICERVLEYEDNRCVFIQKYADETAHLKKQVVEAKKLIDEIVVPNPMLQLAATYCAKALVEGHRGEFILLATAKAIAALNGRNFLIPEDMERAAYFVLPHRMRKLENTEDKGNSTDTSDDNNQNDGQEPDDYPDQENSSSEQSEDSDMPDDDMPTEDGEIDNQEDSHMGGENELENSSDSDDESGNAGIPQELWEDINKAFSGLQMQLISRMDRHKRKGSGKRQRTRTDLHQGRYIRSVPMSNEIADIAIDATIRAAAPYQRYREKNGLSLILKREDLRKKVREKRTGTVFLFCVDASGSMGAKQRMGAVKGAIYGLFQDAYEQRDKVGLIVFRKDRAEMLLPVTRSIDLAQRELRELPTGGRTPLAAGLELSLMTIAGLHYADSTIRPIFILVTDGRATVSVAGGNPVEEALSLADKFTKIDVSSVVIDTETDFISMGISKKIAARMGAQYHHIKEISDEQVLSIVSEMRS